MITPRERKYMSLKTSESIINLLQNKRAAINTVLRYHIVVYVVNYPMQRKNIVSAGIYA